MPGRLSKRGGVWYYVRRVPKAFEAVDPRRPVKLSTGIMVRDDRAGAKAARKAKQLEIDLEASWRASAGHTAQDAALRLDDARARAQALGLPYKPIEDVVREDLAEILRRVTALEAGDRRHDPATVAAAVGGVPLPAIMLSGLPGEVEIAKKAMLSKYSPNQLRKWRNGKVRAIARLVEVVGDKPFDRLSREDAVRFVDWWSERVADGEVVADTANRNLTHITGMISAVARRHRLALDRVFAGLRLEGEASRPRPPFSAWWIVNRLLAPGSLDAMNAEERAILLVMVNTGARPSEIANLRAAHVHLEADIPHVQVRPDDRVLKTEFSWRDLPLVGVSLQAMRQFPDGFPRYRDNGDALSAAANKFLEEHGLRETPKHTLYSLRHAFKDRLRETPATDELKDELMGHDTKKPKYGDGHGLHLKLKIVEQIALAQGMQVAQPLQLVKAAG